MGQFLFPILVGQAPSFEETINWLQFAYTTDRTGAYVAPASTFLVPSKVSEGDPIFPAFWRHLLRRFPGVYAPTPTTHGPLGSDYLGYHEVAPTPTTIVPLGPDYFDGYQEDQAPEHRDRSVRKERGDKIRNTNINFSLG